MPDPFKSDADSAESDLKGVYSRMPKQNIVGDEPNPNESRLRGIAKRTPQKTMQMDEADANPLRNSLTKTTRTVSSKPPSPAASASGSASGGSRIRGGIKVGPPDDSKPSIEAESAAPKDAPQIAGKYPRQQAMDNLPTKAVPPKKRNAMIRIASAVGRGIAAPFRGGQRKPTQAMKRDLNQGKSVRV